MSAFTTSFTGVKVVSKTTVAKKTVSTKAVASFDNVKKVRRGIALADRGIGPKMTRARPRRRRCALDRARVCED